MPAVCLFVDVEETQHTCLQTVGLILVGSIKDIFHLSQLIALFILSKTPQH